VYHKIQLRFVGGLALFFGAALGIMSAVLLYIGGLIAAIGFLSGGYIFLRGGGNDSKRAAIAHAAIGSAVIGGLCLLARLFPPSA